MPILNSFLLSLVAGLATGLGGALVAAFGRLSMRTYETLLGLAAGVMTSIATFGPIHGALGQGSTPSILARIVASWVL